MTVQCKKMQNPVLEKLQDEFNLQLSGDVAAKVTRFAQLHFSLTAEDDLLERRFDSLYGATLECWHFVQHFSGNNAKVRVFNPDFEENGWQTTHTVVMVLQKDMPFLIDSVRMEINRRALKIHHIDNSILSYRRNGEGELINFSPLKDGVEQPHLESIIYLEIDRHTHHEQLQDLTRSLQSILHEVCQVTSDYPAMRDKALQLVDQIPEFAEKLSKHDQKELADLINWLVKNHFTFLGYEAYQLLNAEETAHLQPVKGSELGLFRSCDEQSRQVQIGEILIGPHPKLGIENILTFTKSPSKSRVHRPAYCDYISIKTYDKLGQVSGEHRFIGLFTSRVYLQTTSMIPVIRHKVASVLKGSGLHSGSHDWKELEQILETYPRDELLQMSFDELFSTALQVLRIHERRLTRLFIRRDVFSRYYSCLVYVPRDIYSTDFRIRVEQILQEELHSAHIDFNTHFSESILARTHFIAHVDLSEVGLEIDKERIEQRVIAASRSWEDDLQDALVENYGEEKGVHFINHYGHAFPAAYRDDFTPRTAVADIQHLSQLSNEQPLSMSFYREIEQAPDQVNFKLFHVGDPLPLSDVIPVMENLGLRVMDEHPYAIRHPARPCWIHDFRMLYQTKREIDVQQVREDFQQAFARVWNGEADSDDFNRLVLAANLDWREVWMLRAYAAYTKQLKFGISQLAMATCLIQHMEVTERLVALFYARFEPERQNVKEQEKLEAEILAALDRVPSLTDDRIIRRYLDLMKATLRTNFFQTNDQGDHHPYLSFKLAPGMLADIPQPKPMFEIFVHSPRVQGAHLRAGKVARGGLRWSDRSEDFRTEVLGLVKAQQVKNAVIVPVGAKGGFVPKRLHDSMNRDQFMEEGIACYKLFISGLLDITDNIVNGEVVPPQQVVRHDEDDPYLVVAADKGTATFSDIANEISKQRGFWLGDAFASGGSQGYDHKKMGITARGAWVSVERHFREMGHNTRQQNFTVIGIGDMSGDVFGNGMLLSEHIQLVAAFNHLHIFIDPQPDAAASFAERQRLFALPRSSWFDFDESLISKGGGIFERKAKYINITPEMKSRFDLKANRLTPSELIHELLKAPVDLLWNGGIGTYVKSSDETHGDVGDKANDSIRINAKELRAKVVGEGGNLGLTQQARIEYSLNNGRCNTDFIDNAGGVDCSDHEVNLKILLDGFQAAGDMTAKQRNKMLVEMTEAVSELVLKNNYQQVQSLSLSEALAVEKIDDYGRVIHFLEQRAKLDRELEYLPSDEQLAERKQNNQGLTRPELSVMLSYGKALLKQELDCEELAEDPHASKELQTAFPQQLTDHFGDSVYGHKLKQEIIATQIANQMMNDMGVAYLHGLESSTAFGPVPIAKAYLLARDVFHLQDTWQRIESLDNLVDAKLQQQMMLQLQRLVRRTSRWFLRNRRLELNIQEEMETFAPAVKALLENLGDWLHGSALEAWQQRHQDFLEQGVDELLACIAASTESLYMALGAIEVSRLADYPLPDVIDAYCVLGERLEMYWFAKALTALEVNSHWQSLAREAYRDDLDWQVRSLATSLLKERKPAESLDSSFERWFSENETRAQRWLSIVCELKSSDDQDYSMFTVATRELFDLAKGASLAETS